MCHVVTFFAESCCILGQVIVFWSVVDTWIVINRPTHRPEFWTRRWGRPRIVNISRAPPPPPPGSEEPYRKLLHKIPQ